MSFKQNEKNTKNKKEPTNTSPSKNTNNEVKEEHKDTDIFQTTYEKVLSIINTVKDFIKKTANSPQKLVDDLEWVIKVITNQSLYKYEVNKEKIMKKNSDYNRFINFVTKYNEEVIEMNKKHILVSSLLNIGKKEDIVVKPSLCLRKVLPDEMKNMDFQKEKEKKERKKKSIKLIGNIILNLYYKGLERQKKEEAEKAAKEKKEKESKDRKKSEKQSGYTKKEVKFKAENPNKNTNITISVNDSNAHRIKRVRTMGSNRNNNLNKVSINDTDKKSNYELRTKIKKKMIDLKKKEIGLSTTTLNKKVTLTNIKKAMEDYYITQVHLNEPKYKRPSKNKARLINTEIISNKNRSRSVYASDKTKPKIYKHQEINSEKNIDIHIINSDKNRNINTIINSDKKGDINTIKTDKNRDSNTIKSDKNRDIKNIKTDKPQDIIPVIPETTININIDIKKNEQRPPLNTLIDKYFNELKKITDRDFNIFEFKKIVGYDNVLPLISYIILKTLGLLEPKIIVMRKLDSFLYCVSDNYRETTLYHNSLHGVDVAHNLCNFFINSNIEEVSESTVLDILGVIISAIGHDLGHPGYTNTYHINAANDLALTFNDKSCLENYHTSLLFRILKKDENNIFEKFNTQNFKNIRKRMISQILATDMANHGQVVSLMKAKINANEDEGHNSGRFNLLSGNEKTKFDEQQILFNYLIHAADLGHNTKKFDISLKWVELLSEEFWNQGDVEKRKGYPISFLCDRTKVDIPSSQVGFIKGFIVSTYESIVKMFPTLQYTLDHTYNNIKEWQKLVEQHRLRGWTPPKKENKKEKKREKSGKKIMN